METKELIALEEQLELIGGAVEEAIADLSETVEEAIADISAVESKNISRLVYKSSDLKALS